MYLDIEVLFKVFIFWQLSLMLEPSYMGNKTGDTRIKKIHHLITAEGFFYLGSILTWTDNQSFLHIQPTNIVLKGGFWYSFYACIHASVCLSLIYHLSSYLPVTKNIKIKFATKQKPCLFSHKSHFQRRHFRQNTFVHQCRSNPVKSLFRRTHFLRNGR